MDSQKDESKLKDKDIQSIEGLCVSNQGRPNITGKCGEVIKSKVRVSIWW